MWPPCNTIRTSPETCSWVFATKLSSATFNGENHSPS
ncbi:Uncharacterised protein [Mycobacterium tuberculosis]|nr:Uncharacterised protein [Mycobacterium tuberculosis]